ncbi:MAG: hypothetical protein IIC90_12310 [Chloroflexi bacterium]|nr:hypothetical protein [Chloroflexota bacterium]
MKQGAIPNPPASLKASGLGRKFWRDVLREYELEASDLLVLEQAGVALDRGAAARELIDLGGLLIKGSRGGLTKNPALAIEARAERAFLAARKELALDRADGAQARQERTLRGRFAGPEIRRTG